MPRTKGAKGKKESVNSRVVICSICGKEYKDIPTPAENEMGSKNYTLHICNSSFCQWAAWNAVRNAAKKMKGAVSE